MTKRKITAEQFAAKAPIGTPVRYWPVLPCRDDEFVETAIRSEPWALGHGAIVVKVEGRAGGVSIEHITFPPAA